MQVSWATQNEATDADGFLLDREACWRAELECLASMGCPDTHKAKLIGVEVMGREESITTANVSGAMSHWLFNETDAEDFEYVA
jgi:hypothetical protein